MIVDPSQVADQLSSFWKPLWQAPHDVACGQPWPEFDELMQILPMPPQAFCFDNSLTAWKQVIKSLRTTSARGFDAVSAQELKMLPDGLIQELIQVMDQYKKGFPSWFMQARVCPLSKVDTVPLASQSRPICILSQLYRVYAAVFCKQVLRFWGTWFPSEICGMLPCRGSHDAAYAVQAQLELAHVLKTNLSGLTLDIKKCFNCIRHESGRRLLLALGLPRDRIHQFYHSIRKMTRFWEVDGQSFGPLHATCGFPEGDSHSVLIMLAISLLWLCHLKRSASPNLRASAYADNWAWNSNAPGDHLPAANATTLITGLCGLEVDWKKTWMWATSTPLAKQVMQSLSQVLPADQLQRLHNAKDLGFQLHYSGCRELGHRKDRQDAGFVRLTKLAGMPHDLSTKEHLLQTSVFPAMFYGAELFPVAQDMLSKVRSAAADALLGKSHSMSPAIPLSLTKNAILDPGYFVVLQALRSAMHWLSLQSRQVCQQFFQVAASFTGCTRNTKGPATTLKHYVTQFAWNIDKLGYIWIDGVVKVHLLRDGFPRLKWFLDRAWHQQLILMHTARFSQINLPDISRLDTVAVLAKFSDADRRLLLRELAGAYQLEQQKQKWTEDATGQCQFCEQQDSKEHRLYDCPAFAETREPYREVIQQIHHEGFTFSDLAVVHAHPDHDFHHLLHYQQASPVIAVQFKELAESRLMTNQPCHVYVDGSCQHPAHPTTRYAAYAGIMDIATSDEQRKQLADRFLVTGEMPTTLVPCFAARVCGEQTISRAELLAIVAAAELPGVFVHSDSQFAITRAKKSRSETSSFHALSHADLVWKLRDMQFDVSRLCKVKAHQDLTQMQDLLQIYHALGNTVADLTAKQAAKELLQPWQQELETLHTDTHRARELLYHVYAMQVELCKARAKHAQDLNRQEDTQIPQNAKTDLKPIIQVIQEWRPDEKQQLVFPANIDNWAHMFSWGSELAVQLFEWMQLFEWPAHPQGPLDKEIGITWLELAISFSMHVKRALPVLRKNSDKEDRLLMIEDLQDVAAHSVTLTDQANTLQRMWTQTQIWLPGHSLPKCSRGLQTSLYVQGFGQNSSGMSLRPFYPFQHAVAEFLAPLISGKMGYDIPFEPFWLLERRREMKDYSWKRLCDDLKCCRNAKHILGDFSGSAKASLQFSRINLSLAAGNKEFLKALDVLFKRELKLLPGEGLEGPEMSLAFPPRTVFNEMAMLQSSLKDLGFGAPGWRHYW
eukprot:s820_g1.t1